MKASLNNYHDCSPSGLSYFHNLTRMISMDGLYHFVGTSAKVVISGSAALAVVLNRGSLSASYFVVFALGNALFGKLLKRFIKQPRPASSPKQGYGMPSSHSQSIFYFLAVSSIKILSFESCSSTSPSSSPSNAATTLLQSLSSSVSSVITQSPMLSITVLSAYTISACSWRVTSGRHTWAQTGVGAICGSFVGLLACNLERNVLENPTIVQVFGVEALPIQTATLLSIGAAILFREQIKKNINFFGKKMG